MDMLLLLFLLRDWELTVEDGKGETKQVMLENVIQ